MKLGCSDKFRIPWRALNLVRYSYYLILFYYPSFAIFRPKSNEMMGKIKRLRLYCIIIYSSWSFSHRFYIGREGNKHFITLRKRIQIVHLVSVIVACNIFLFFYFEYDIVIAFGKTNMNCMSRFKVLLTIIIAHF